MWCSGVVAPSFVPVKLPLLGLPLATIETSTSDASTPLPKVQLLPTQKVHDFCAIQMHKAAAMDRYWNDTVIEPEQCTGPRQAPAGHCDSIGSGVAEWEAGCVGPSMAKSVCTTHWAVWAVQPRKCEAVDAPPFLTSPRLSQHWQGKKTRPSLAPCHVRRPVISSGRREARPWPDIQSVSHWAWQSE